MKEGRKEIKKGEGQKGREGGMNERWKVRKDEKSKEKKKIVRDFGGGIER